MNATRHLLAAMSALTLVAACENTKPTRQSDTTTVIPPPAPTVTRLDASAYSYVGVVGDVTSEDAYVTPMTGANIGVLGAMVHFAVSDSGQVTDSAPAILIAGAPRARATWTLGAKVGTQTLTATADTATLVLTATAHARPATIELPDTIRYTRARQSKSGFLTVRDSGGAPITYYKVTWNWAGLVEQYVGNPLSPSALMSPDSAVNGYVVVRSLFNPGVMDSAVVVNDYIPAAFTVKFSDAEPTLAVGAQRGWTITAVDSGGRNILGFKATLSSSDSSVVQVSNAGVTGGSAGAATVSVRWRDSTVFSLPIVVYPALDLGSVHGRSLGISNYCPVYGLLAVPLSAAAQKSACLGPPPKDINWQIYPDGGAQLSLPLIALTFDGGSSYIPGSPASLSAGTPSAPSQARWTRSLSQLDGCSHWPSLAVSSSGARVFVKLGCGIAAVDSSSTLKWVSTTLNGTRGIAAVGDSVYVLDDNAVALVGSDGAPRWTTPVNSVSSGIVMSNGAIAVQQEPTAVSLVSNAGVVVWRVTGLPDLSLTTWMVLDPQDNIYRASAKKVYSLSADGSIRWQTDLPTSAGQLMFASDGVLYMAGAYSGHVFAINPATGAILGRSPGGLSATSCLGSSIPGRPAMMALTSGRLWGTDGCSELRWFDVPFGPATGWSQAGGSAGSTKSRVVPR